MSLAEAGAALLASLSGRRPRILTVEVPPSPEGWQAWWSADLPGAPTAVLCRPPSGRRLWGRGEARATSAQTRDLRAFWADWEEGGDPGPPPALFAALPFDPAAPADALWGELGQGSLILPRWTWEEQGGRAWLRLAVEDPEGQAEALRAEWAAICAAAPAGAGATAPPIAAPVDAAAWDQQIAEVLAQIAAGSLQKLVLARAARYALPAPVADQVALARLAATQPGCTVFGIRRGGATFLGATPERLLARAGRRVEADALAGTGASPDGLLASEKDRWEHQLVVEAIAASLGPRCASLSWPAAPEVVRLRDLCHLRSPFSGLLAGEDPARALADRLHPTPAVGGAPREAALALIRRLEQAPRGLYAGPVGWLDRAGDGALWVALRSGLLRGATLHLFAGVGVVAGSTAAAELAETRRKLAAMEAAFSP